MHCTVRGTYMLVEGKQGQGICLLAVLAYDLDLVTLRCDVDAGAVTSISIPVNMRWWGDDAMAQG